jgi:hypothetical protein
MKCHINDFYVSAYFFCHYSVMLIAHNLPSCSNRLGRSYVVILVSLHFQHIYSCEHSSFMGLKLEFIYVVFIFVYHRYFV